VGGLLEELVAAAGDAAKEGLLQRWGGLVVPTLLLSGRYDEATPVLQEPLLGGIAGSRHQLFEQSSHMPFWEERTAYMQAAGAWLTEFDRSASTPARLLRAETRRPER